MAEDEMPVLLTAARIAAMAGLAKTHFLNPGARRLNKSLGDATGLTGIGVHLIEIPPGAESTEHHLHHHEDECVFVLSGEGVAIVGEAEHPIGPGDFLGHARGGAAHSLRNDGAAPLRALVIGERRRHDVADYPRQGLRLYRQEGLAWDLVEHAVIAHPRAGAKG